MAERQVVALEAAGSIPVGHPRLFERAMVRALELLDLSIRDGRWRRRLKELTRARELLCDAWLGGREYRTELEDLNRYFFHFALAARK